MTIVNSRMGWYSSPSAWEQTQVWAAKRRAMLDDFGASASALNAVIADAHTAQISGTANLAARAALKRVQGAARAKLDTKA